MSAFTSRIAKVATLSVLLVAGGVARPQATVVSADSSTLADAQHCSSLAQSAGGSDITIVSAELVKAGTPFGPMKSSTRSDFCRVVAIAQPEFDSRIGFEVWLPPRSQWNGRFQGVGGGGNSGFIVYSSWGTGTRGLAAAVDAGFAAVSTDNGHVGQGSTFMEAAVDQSWAIGHPAKVVDFGFRAIHVTTVVAKDIVLQFYGRPPDYSYWVGCSQGGGKGLMNAQRWPHDYDGILAGSPVAQWTRAMISATAVALPGLRDPSAWVPETKRMVLHDEVMQQCDAADGLEDGILSQPTECRFDIQKITCTEEDLPTCLSGPQAQAIMSAYTGQRRRNGTQLADPYMLGSESAWPWIGAKAPTANWVQFWKSVIFEDPKYDLVKSLNPERDYDYALKKVGWAYDADNPDLTPFYRNGGKLIVFHGEADQAISPVPSSQYYEDVVEVMGREKVDSFYRYFLIPSMNHCGGGVGPNTFDPLPALQDWVEQGIAPNLTVSDPPDRSPVRTRPLCQYPATAQYTGAGDINDAGNFTCRVPEPAGRPSSH